jgi:molybdate transport system substrate-binding protein
LDQIVLEGRDKLAITNPELAPYGRAAQQVLAALGRDQALADRLVMGQDVGQTWQFFHTGAVPVALVARSQVESLRRTHPGQVPRTVIRVPWELYDPLIQEVVTSREAPPAAQAFLGFVRGDEGAAILHSFGFLPPPKSVDQTP